MQGMVPGMLIVLLSIIWLSASGLAMSGTPTEFVRQTTDSILQVFEDPRLQGPEHREERLARLRHIANTAFDWEEIARRALATHWRDRTPKSARNFLCSFATPCRRCTWSAWRRPLGNGCRRSKP